VCMQRCQTLATAVFIAFSDSEAPRLRPRHCAFHRHSARPLSLMLSVSNVSKTYAGRTLFSQVSFHINRGEKIGLIGPNGAGKSTLFSLLLRDTTPDDGQVVMERGITFGFLPQESAPIEDVTVLELATGHVDEHQRW